MAEITNYGERYEIPRGDWNDLRDLYALNWPQHILSFYTLKTYNEWIEEDPKHDVTIYTADENWREHGTYLLVEHAGPRCNVLFNTLEPEKNGHLLLKALNFLPPTAAYTFAAFVEQVRPIAEKYLKSLGFGNFDYCDTVLYHMPQECASELNVASKLGYEFKSLTSRDVPIVDGHWPHQYPGSDLFIGNLIRHNVTLGAYDDQEGKLCAWVMQEQVGTICLLQVLESHQRQGLGKILVCLMAKLLAKMGMDATATVMNSNLPSRHLFEKLGFRAIDKAYWYDKLGQ